MSPADLLVGALAEALGNTAATTPTSTINPETQAIAKPKTSFFTGTMVATDLARSLSGSCPERRPTGRAAAGKKWTSLTSHAAAS